jgi:hypothetical protein
MFNLFAKKATSLDEQLAIFKELGIEINKSVDLTAIIENYGGKEEFENEPFLLLYIVLCN